MSKKIAIIGGDKRIIELSKILSNDGNILYLYGLEEAQELKKSKNVFFCETLNEVIEESDFIIGSIPFQNENGNLFSPYAKKSISVEDLLSKMENKVLIAGNIKSDIYNCLNSENNIKIIDILNREELAILNAISTAEGAISIAIENTDKIIHGKNVLILGFGRIGKVLSKKLTGLSANITCAARKDEDFAWIEACGYKKININYLRRKSEKI